MFGDVWEWTGSAYLPYPAIVRRPARSANTTASSCAISIVLRGGSCATPDGHPRATYRNFFYPHQRWQFMGLRLAEDRLMAVPSRMEPLASGAAHDDFARAVIEGLSQRQKSLPCRFFYDARGSALFEEITELPEYYPTRTETAMLGSPCRRDRRGFAWAA